MASLSYNDTVVAICEFLEVAIHTVLCLRGVYPAQVFAKRKKYDAPVYESRSPALNDYIAESVRAVGQELLLGTVKSFVLVIKDQSQVALERFVFSIDAMIDVDPQHRDTPIPDGVNKTALEQYFRSFLVKLATIGADLVSEGIDEEELSFALVLEMKDEETPSTAPNELDPVPWMPAVKQYTTEGMSEESQVHIVRAVETGIFDFSLVIQESQEKVEKLKQIKGKGKARAE